MTTCGGLIGFALECGPGVYPIVIIYPKSGIILDNSYRWFASNVMSPLGIVCYGSRLIGSVIKAQLEIREGDQCSCMELVPHCFGLLVPPQNIM